MLLHITTACVTIKDARTCSVAGTLLAGGICAHTLTSQTEDLSMDDFLNFLEAEPEKPDPNDASKTIPAHAAAICMSAEDWNTMKTELELACRQMGSHCSYATKLLIQKLRVPKRVG